MDLSQFQRHGEWVWELPRRGRMRTPGIFYASETLLREMDDKVAEQVANVAALPGIVRTVYVMPDAHWGYGFPIGGVAAFDPEEGGVISAGGVGFDISCGVRALLTGLTRADVERRREKLADALFSRIPAGVGSISHLRLGAGDLTAMLRGGARWAVERGLGQAADLARIEHNGTVADADPARVSDQALAAAFGLRRDEVVIGIHCGSRGLGHQVATEYARAMLIAAPQYGVVLHDRELAAVPVASPPGQAYYGAMCAAANCALANRQILMQGVRGVLADVFGPADRPLLYDVSHNLCSREKHLVDGVEKDLYVHRKGATRALGPGHPELPAELQATGQPVLIGGTMGTASYILAGTRDGEALAFSSACHGAGRSLSRSQALKQFQGKQIAAQLAHRGISVRTGSLRGLAEEAPAAYKDVSAVVEATATAGLARTVARLDPLICVKG